MRTHFSLNPCIGSCQTEGIMHLIYCFHLGGSVDIRQANAKEHMGPHACNIEQRGSPLLTSGGRGRLVSSASLPKAVCM